MKYGAEFRRTAARQALAFTLIFAALAAGCVWLGMRSGRASAYGLAGVALVIAALALAALVKISSTSPDDAAFSRERISEIRRHNKRHRRPAMICSVVVVVLAVPLGVFQTAEYGPRGLVLPAILVATSAFTLGITVLRDRGERREAERA